VLLVEHKVNSGIWGTMFGVPYVVADNFLKLASGGQLKVLLFILRSSGRKLSADEIAHVEVDLGICENALRERKAELGL
jgi:hypothetical protein